MQLYARVLWRWWPVVLIGLLVAVALTFLSIFRVDSHRHLSARKSTQYVSYATVLVTQPGFPSGRLGLEPMVAAASATAQTGGKTPQAAGTTPQATGTTPQTSQGQLADLSRLTSLAILYSHLATSDPVRAIMLHHGPMNGTIQAAALPATQNGNEALPIVSIAAITDSKRQRDRARQQPRAPHSSRTSSSSRPGTQSRRWTASSSLCSTARTRRRSSRSRRRRSRWSSSSP